MKFENSRFRIIVEKNESGKMRDRRMNKRNILLSGCSIIFLLLVVVFAVYSGKNPEKADSGLKEAAQVTNASEEMNHEVEVSGEDMDENTSGNGAEGDFVPADYLAAAAKEKYSEEELFGYTYGEPYKGIGRSDSIILDIAFDPKEKGFENWDQIVSIYQDPQLKHTVGPNWSYDKEKGQVSLLPPNYTAGRISTSGLTVEQVVAYEHSDMNLFDKATGTDWGNIGTLYMARYVDMETGQKLEVPEVSIVTLKGEVEANPVISFTVTENGLAALNWEPVEGAEQYFVCLMNFSEDTGYTSSCQAIGVTNENRWEYGSPEFSTYATANKLFRSFDVSEDDWLDPEKAENARSRYGIEEGVYLDTEAFGEKALCVIAVNKEGTSMASNLYPVSDLAANLPYVSAYNAGKLNGFTNGDYESAEKVSAYGYVTMCDGYTATKLIDYDTEKAKLTANRYVTVDEKDEYVKGENVSVLEIPYTIEGTPFTYVATIVDYDESSMEKDLSFLEEREEKLRKKSGDITVSVGKEFGQQNQEQDTKKLTVRKMEDASVTANCALAEYLAANMLGQAAYIDLSSFREAGDEEFLMDAWMEAYYQNPLILGIQGYRLNKNSTAMRLIYDDDASVTEEKQKEILNAVEKINAQIIQDSMSDLEKELAINQYLCDTVTYDEEALLNAEENDFLKIDEKYNDSFTAYGALINGKSVCSGYAGAFKLLADDAGLNSIVVTGTLEGSLSHAWNKVLIDGDWKILDVTNNDNEYLFNALLNLPDDEGGRVLVEDKDYVVDQYIVKYQAVGDEKEYYRINDKYFDYDVIAKELSSGLAESTSTTLRTDYALDDEGFYEIAEGVYDIMGDEIDLYGFYWMGVIYMSLQDAD